METWVWLMLLAAGCAISGYFCFKWGYERGQDAADVYSDGDDSVRARLNADQTVTVTCSLGYQSIASMLNKVNEHVSLRCKRNQVRDAVVAMRAVPFTDGVLSAVPWIVDLQKNKREIRFVLSPVWFYGITEMMPSRTSLEEDCSMRLEALRDARPESCTGPWVAFECAHGRIVCNDESFTFDSPEVIREYLDLTPEQWAHLLPTLNQADDDAGAS